MKTRQIMWTGVQSAAIRLNVNVAYKGISLKVHLHWAKANTKAIFSIFVAAQFEY